MDNTSHSFTEAAVCESEKSTETAAKNYNMLRLHLGHIEVTMALAKFVELHEREAVGDDTITVKEWKSAIANGRKALEKATN